MAQRSKWSTAPGETTATPSRDEDADGLTAEIGALYIDPDYWRQGTGNALLTAALEELGERSFRDVILWVLPENRAAVIVPLPCCPSSNQ